MQARKGEFLMENKKLGALAFLPLIVFLGTYIGCGIVFSVMGAESPFGYFPRHVALLVGIASALILGTGGEDFREGRCPYRKYGPQRCYDDRSDLSYGQRISGRSSSYWRQDFCN